MPPTDPRGLELFEITTALVVALVCGWAAWNLIKPFIESWRARREAARIWDRHRERCEAERLGLGTGDPTFLRGQRPRERGRR